MPESVYSHWATRTGYRIVEALIVSDSPDTGEVAMVVTNLVPLSKKTPSRRYDPLAELSLFRRFAALDGSEKSILRFAKRYGFLFAGDKDKQRIIELAPSAEPAQPPTLGVGERLHDWQAAIKDMRRAVELWRMILNNSRPELSEHIKWNEHENWVWYQEKQFALPSGEVVPDGKYSTITVRDTFMPELYQELDDKAGTRPLRKPAVFLLQRWVNDKLKDNMGVRLLESKGAGGLGLEVCIFPYTLLGAMWYQLAQELADPDKQKVTLCESCGKPFAYQRSTRRYCSEACQSRAKRRSTKQASSE